MKIISLLPAATEIVYLLGLEKDLAAVSDDSDYPPAITKIPKITSSLVSQSLSSREIDTKVKNSKHTGIGVFHLDQDSLKKLKPDLILTQELCEVCAISFTEVKKSARILDGDTKIISLESESIGGILQNIKLIGRLTKKEKVAGKKAHELEKTINNIQKKIPQSFVLSSKSILIIEWLDPIMVAAHWVPEMVEFAGGEAVFAKAGERSREVSWEDILNVDPDVIIIAPCGFSINRTKKELHLITNKKGFKNLKAVKNNNVFLMDGNAYLTRPGPRIVDGIEIFAEILHSEIFKRRYSLKAWEILT